eukprot:56949_1
MAFYESYKNKNFEEWTNQDLVDWIKNIKLSEKWTSIMVEAVKSTECTGDDWMGVESGQDLIDSFDFTSKMLAKKVYAAFKKAKEGTFVNNDNVTLFKDKKIKKWSNKDLCDWVKSIDLTNNWQDTMIQAIENTGCTGQ